MFKKKPKATPAQKAKVSKVFHEYGENKLHSGSKQGPVVKSHDQATAIALSEAGLSNKQHGRREGAGAVYSQEKYPLNAPDATGPRGIGALLAESGAGPSKADVARPYGDQTEKDHWDRGQPKQSHSFKPAIGGAHGYGHSIGQRVGHLRTSGKGHQIGKR